MTDKKLDEMMTAYCDPEVEKFEFKEKNKSRTKAVSALAAALVLVMLAAFIIPAFTGTEHSFVLTVNAAERKATDEQVGTAYSVVAVYDKNNNPIGSYYTIGTQILMNGEDIDDISFRSLNGYGEFMLWRNSDKDSWRDDTGMWYDADGNEDSFFNGAPDGIFDRLEGEYYAPAEIVHTNDWSTEYRYALMYYALNDERKFFQPDEGIEGRDDIIEIKVTFSDGDTMTKRLSVTYPGGVITVSEIS